MNAVIPLLAALATLVAGIVAARLWYARVQTPRHAQRIGIEALAARHWRDPMSRLVEALSEEGFEAGTDLADANSAPRGERLLRRGKETVLLIYKHGTSYRLGSPALLDAEKRRQEAGIDEVMLATLGAVDAEARAQATRMHITCLDGADVWAKLASRIDASTRAAIDEEARQLADGGQRLSTVGACVAALGAFVWMGGPAMFDGAADAANPTASTTRGIVAPRAANPAPRPASTQAPGVDEAGAASEPSLGQRRAALAKAVAALSEVDRASWSSESTLVLSLRRRAAVEPAFERVCALAPAFDLLREVRLQIEVEGDVRWRRCG